MANRKDAVPWIVGGLVAIGVLYVMSQNSANAGQGSGQGNNQGNAGGGGGLQNANYNGQGSPANNNTAATTYGGGTNGTNPGMNPVNYTGTNTGAGGTQTQGAATTG